MKVSRLLDELTLGEAVLQREAHRALSGGAFGIGGAFLRTARAIGACSETLTDSAATKRHQTARLASAVREAIEALTVLERWLPSATDRFTSLLVALRQLQSECSDGSGATPPVATDPARQTRADSTLLDWNATASVELSAEELRDTDPVTGMERAACGPTRVGELVRYPDPDDFDPARLEGQLDEVRLNALCDGAEPSLAELDLWIRNAMTNHEGSAPQYHLVSLWEAKNEHGEHLVWANLHEDQGAVWQRIGPYSSVEEVETALAAIGRLTWSGV